MKTIYDIGNQIKFAFSTLLSLINGVMAISHKSIVSGINACGKLG